MNTSELVQPRHLSRRAAIYVRQSTPSQVLTNKESRRMQYALRERAAGLGWQEADIQVVDAEEPRRTGVHAGKSRRTLAKCSNSTCRQISGGTV